MLMRAFLCERLFVKITGHVVFVAFRVKRHEKPLIALTIWQTSLIGLGFHDVENQT